MKGSLSRADKIAVLTRALRDPVSYAKGILHQPLYPYQERPALHIARLVLSPQADTYVLRMPRQTGKNQISATVQAWLLARFARRGGIAVKTAPSFRPQLVNSMTRLKGLLQAPFTRRRYSTQLGYIVSVGRASIHFLSADPHANVVGATASTLLEADESQHIEPGHFHTTFTPMAASTAAPTVLYGTAWMSTSLLAMTWKALPRSHRLRITWRQVARDLPRYARFVQQRIAELGPDHAIIRTQYDTIDLVGGESSFLDPGTRVLMRGTHAPHLHPMEGYRYAITVDVAGSPEGTITPDPRRDFTALTIYAVSVDPTSRLNHYHVARRYLWRDIPHVELAGVIATIARTWGVYALVIDATGVGSGLASSLAALLPVQTRPFKITAKSKSEMGWGFLGICKSSRFHDHAADGSEGYERFWRQVGAATKTIRPGPDEQMTWGVSDRDVHDDLLLSAALCATLDVAMPSPQKSYIIEDEWELPGETRHELEDLADRALPL